MHFVSLQTFLKYMFKILILSADKLEFFLCIPWYFLQKSYFHTPDHFASNRKTFHVCFGFILMLVFGDTYLQDIMVMVNVIEVTYRLYNAWPLFLHCQYKELRAERGNHKLQEVIGGRCAGLQSDQTQTWYVKTRKYEFICE